MMTDHEGPFWRPPQSTRKELRQFGLLFTVIAALVAGWIFWRHDIGSAYLPGSIAVVLLALSLLWPTPLKPFWWPWMVFVNVLGFVNSHLLLALVLFLLFTPIGWALRLFGKKLIDRDFKGARKIVGEGGTLWRQREGSLPDSEHFKRQF